MFVIGRCCSEVCTHMRTMTSKDSTCHNNKRNMMTDKFLTASQVLTFVGMSLSMSRTTDLYTWVSDMHGNVVSDC